MRSPRIHWLHGHQRNGRPDFTIDADYGHRGELLVADTLAMPPCSVEVKTSRFSGPRFFVETEQLPRGERDYVPSGISTSTADWWALVWPNKTFLLVETAALRAAVHAWPERAGGANGSNPTHGHMVNVGEYLHTLLVELP